jgi:hypothetical protein
VDNSLGIKIESARDWTPVLTRDAVIRNLECLLFSDIRCIQEWQTIESNMAMTSKKLSNIELGFTRAVSDIRNHQIVQYVVCLKDFWRTIGGLHFTEEDGDQVDELHG